MLESHLKFSEVPESLIDETITWIVDQEICHAFCR